MYKKLKEQISQNKEKYIKLSEQSEYEKETSSLTKILEEIDKTVRGGLSDTHTVESIAKKHGVSVKDIEKEIEIGKKIEMEHTNSKEESVRIAMDHLVEFPDYYTRLVKMEKRSWGWVERILQTIWRNSSWRTTTWQPWIWFTWRQSVPLIW